MGFFRLLFTTCFFSPWKFIIDYVKPHKAQVHSREHPAVPIVTNPFLEQQRMQWSPEQHALISFPLRQDMGTLLIKHLNTS